MEYTPGPVPNAPEDLPRYLQEELARMSAVLYVGTMKRVEFLDVAPTKVREGRICGADGTNWDPGSGKGVYCYYGAAWHLLG